MMKEFMAGMSEEEKTEMMRLMMPIMMKDMKPQMMAEIMGDFSESDCKKMMMEMPPETREKCKNMMTNCLNTLKEM
jgi:Mg/Co/Ni transporter MgtE